MTSSNQSTKLRLLKLLQDFGSSHPNAPVSLSKLASTLSVSRERVRQLYEQLAGEYALPPVNKRRPSIREITTINAATKFNLSNDMVCERRIPHPQTRALEAEVRKYREQRLSVAEIARKTGRHVRTIQRIHHRLHISFPPKRKNPQILAFEAQVQAYSEQGMFAPEIAKRTGRHERTIYEVLRRLHIPYNRMRRRKREKGRALEEKVRAFNEQGLTVAEIAKRTGRHERTIYEVFFRLRIPLPPKRKNPQTLASEAEIRKYSEQGMTAPEIAKRTGRQVRKIYKVLHRLNIPVKPHKRDNVRF